MSQKTLFQILLGIMTIVIIVLGGMNVLMIRNLDDKTNQIITLKQQLNQKQDKIDDLQIKLSDSNKPTKMEVVKDKLEIAKEKAVEIKDSLTENLKEKTSELKDKIQTKIETSKNKCSEINQQTNQQSSCVK